MGVFRYVSLSLSPSASLRNDRVRGATRAHDRSFLAITRRDNLEQVSPDTPRIRLDPVKFARLSTGHFSRQYIYHSPSRMLTPVRFIAFHGFDEIERPPVRLPESGEPAGKCKFPLREEKVRLSALRDLRRSVHDHEVTTLHTLLIIYYFTLRFFLFLFVSLFLEKEG